jgi:hypothetical protein
MERVASGVFVRLGRFLLEGPRARFRGGGDTRRRRGELRDDVYLRLMMDALRDFAADLGLVKFWTNLGSLALRIRAHGRALCVHDWLHEPH